MIIGSGSPEALENVLNGAVLKSMLHVAREQCLGSWQLKARRGAG